MKFQLWHLTANTQTAAEAPLFSATGTGEFFFFFTPPEGLGHARPEEPDLLTPSGKSGLSSFSTAALPVLRLMCYENTCLPRLRSLGGEPG